MKVSGFLRFSWMIKLTQLNIRLFKFNSINTEERGKICSKLTIKTPERCQWRRSSVFIVRYVYFTSFSGVTIVKFEQVNICRVYCYVFYAWFYFRISYFANEILYEICWNIISEIFQCPIFVSYSTPSIAVLIQKNNILL